MNQKFRKCENVIEELNLNIREVTHENNRLKKEMHRLEMELETHEHACNKTKHNRFESISKQNDILKNRVKSLRNERLNEEKNNSQELRNVEMRIEQLEYTVEKIKQIRQGRVDAEMNVTEMT